MGELFRKIRESVSAEDAARFYGLNVSDRGKALCPWHSDRHPSLSFDRRSGRCHCFSCGMGGDAIDIAAVLLGASPLQAAQRIVEDFCLDIDDAAPSKPAPVREETSAQIKRRERETLAVEYSTACDRLHQAQAILERFTPDMATSADFGKALKEYSAAQEKADALLAALKA